MTGNAGDIELTYSAIARSLRASYPSVTVDQVRDVHQALKHDKPVPHGIVGMFISTALKEARVVSR